MSPRRPARAAHAPVVVGADVEPGRGHPIADVLVAPGVLAQPVDEQDAGPRRSGPGATGLDAVGRPVPGQQDRAIPRWSRAPRSMSRCEPTRTGAWRHVRYDADMGVADGWVEIGDRFFVRRYAFYDQNIGLVLGDGAALVIDTRSTYGQAREIVEHVREVTRDPVTIVVDTHGHFDHAFGNAHLPAVPRSGARPAACRSWSGPASGARRPSRADEPELADELAEVVIDPPDRTFDEAATIEVGGRAGRAALPGSRPHRSRRGHHRARAPTSCGRATSSSTATCPFFGDGYPLDWVATAAALADSWIRSDGVIVPGHGDHAGRAFADAQAASFAALAAVARRVHAGELDLEAALADAPVPGAPAGARARRRSSGRSPSSAGRSPDRPTRRRQSSRTKVMSMFTR